MKRIRIAIFAAALLSVSAQGHERLAITTDHIAPAPLALPVLAWPGGLGIPKVITWADTTGASGIAWGTTSSIAAANAYLTYNASNLLLNVPTSKGFAFSANNVNLATISGTTLSVDNLAGLTAANTLTMGATGAELTLNKSGTGDFGIGPNSANSSLAFYAGSAGGVRTKYATVDLNGIHPTTSATAGIGVTGYIAPFINCSSSPASGAWTTNQANVTCGGFVNATGRTMTARRAIIQSTVAGAGAGNVVFTLTDGTNTCTFTILCTSVTANTVIEIAAVNGAGTGCVFNTGALIKAQPADTCATTHPFVNTLQFEGAWN